MTKEVIEGYVAVFLLAVKRGLGNPTAAFCFT